MTGSLTGDPELDRLVGPAMRLVGAAHMWDHDEVRAAFDDAARTSGLSELDTARAMSVLCAAMVPWDHTPTELLRWATREPEYRRLVDVGVDPASAADVCAGLTTHTARDHQG